MLDGQAHRQFAKIAEKWRDFVERRRLHYVELHRSGRWKVYYTEAEFARRMREAEAAVETWAALVPPAPTEAAATQEKTATAVDAIAAALAAFERRRRSAA